MPTNERTTKVKPESGVVEESWEIFARKTKCKERRFENKLEESKKSIQSHRSLWLLFHTVMKSLNTTKVKSSSVLQIPNSRPQTPRFLELFMPSPRFTNPSQTSDYETHSRVICAAYSCCLHHRRTKESRSECKEEKYYFSRKNQNKEPIIRMECFDGNQRPDAFNRGTHFLVMRPPEKPCQVVAQVMQKPDFNISANIFFYYFMHRPLRHRLI